MNNKEPIIRSEQIERLIFYIRNQKVMLDADFARIYGVTTARLNQQVKRNRDRFPEDFMFQLTKDEFDRLILQNATSKTGRRNHRKLSLSPNLQKLFNNLPEMAHSLCFDVRLSDCANNSDQSYPERRKGPYKCWPAYGIHEQISCIVDEIITRNRWELVYDG